MLETCTRCGMVWEINTTRKNHDLCESCRARKRQKVKDCIVWHGHFGSDMVTPVDDDGLEVLPGKRTCGNADCVSPAHVKSLWQEVK
jgi:hypothetical protein